MKSVSEIAAVIAKIYEIKLPASDMEQLASIIDFRKLEKGELLLEQGAIAKDFIYVESGMLRQFYYKKDHEITEHFTCENSTLAYCIISLFKKQPTELMIEALEQSIIYTISYERLKILSSQLPGITKLYIKILESGLILSQQKADSWRFETARERYERFVKEYPEIAKRGSVNHIASYLLMTPESLSRVRAGVL